MAEPIPDLRNGVSLPVLAPLGSEQEQKRRGEVELIVKSNYPQIQDDNRNGGGPALTKAMDAAGVPESERRARTLQLQGDTRLWQSAPAVLVTSLLLYGS